MHSSYTHILIFAHPVARGRWQKKFQCKGKVLICFEEDVLQLVQREHVISSHARLDNPVDQETP